MFDAIAFRYDRLNHLLSMGVDRQWRRKVVRRVKASHPSTILDLATGTALGSSLNFRDALIALSIGDLVLIVMMIFLLMLIPLAAISVFIIALHESAFNSCSSLLSCGIVRAYRRSDHVQCRYHRNELHHG